MSEYKRLEGVGEASLFRGDPRIPKSDIDSWFREALTEVKQGRARANLYGADAGFCARRNVLLAQSYDLPSTISSASNAYMSIGVALEDMLARSLIRQGRLIEQNRYLIDMPEVKVRGKIDLLVIEPRGRLALIEVKTCGALPTTPKPTHLAQAQTYAAVSGIRTAYLTYLSRNVQGSGDSWSPHLAMRSFEVPTDDSSLLNRLRIALLSDAAIRQRIVPPLPATFRKHTECHVCDFRDLYCWTPRPGTGGSTEPLPLPEATPEQMIRLDSHVAEPAATLLNTILFRKERTIREILEGATYLLDEEYVPLLQKELQETREAIEGL